MSTNATIAVKHNDGSYSQSYLHWDGYVSHAGKRLIENYTTQEEAEALVALGNLSTIGTHVGVKHDFDSHSSEVTREMCCAYGRDRGEADQQALTFTDFVEMAREGMQEQFNYVFIDGAWYVCPSNFHKDALVPLTATEVSV